MSSRRFLAMTLLLALMSGVLEAPTAFSGEDKSQGKASVTTRPDLTKMTGEELVQQLLNKRSLPHAFYELCRRARPKKWDSYADFIEHDEPEEVMLCPQGKGKDPLYLVLCKWDLADLSDRESQYDKQHEKELFGLPTEIPKRYRCPATLLRGGCNQIHCQGDGYASEESRDT